jgi:diamine N-acetyltransferase
MINIRIATAEDADLIADLSRTTFYDSFARFNTKENMELFMNEQFTREKLLEEPGMPGNIFLLAFLDEELVAYARLRESANPPGLENVSVIELARIYAVKQVIGKGAGSALMKQCIELSIKNNKQVLWLGVWEHNHPAIDFYTRWGFEKFGEHEFILGTDVQTDWLMKKTL